MSKDDLIYNDFKIIKNSKENNIIEIKNINIDKASYYKEIRSFSDLFSKSSKNTSAPLRYSSLDSTPLTPNQISIPPTNQPTNQSSIIKPGQTINTIGNTRQNQGTTSQQGRTYNPDAMWSPRSFAGTIYEWNRGVIAISPDGIVKKEKLDGTSKHHADATIRLANALGVNEPEEIAPFQAALNCNQHGITIMQFEGDNCFLYLPNEVTDSQILEITSELTPRSNFNFSFTYGEEIFEEQKQVDVLRFLAQLNDNKGQVGQARQM